MVVTWLTCLIADQAKLAAGEEVPNCREEAAAAQEGSNQL